MSTILAGAIVDGAKSAVDTYTTSIGALNGELETIITSLTGSDFTGDASLGYVDFYKAKILPAITDNLVGQQSLTSSIKSMLNDIQQQLLNKVDPELGENNRNPK